MLTLKQLDKTFGAGTASAHHALCGIDLTLQDGEFVTVIGSNGAGKSTLFGAVSGSFSWTGDALCSTARTSPTCPNTSAQSASRVSFRTRCAAQRPI